MSPKHQRHPNITQTSSSVFILLLWLWLTPKGCGSMSFYMDGSRSKSQIDKSGSRSGSNIFFFYTVLYVQIFPTSSLFSKIHIQDPKPCFFMDLDTEKIQVSDPEIWTNLFPKSVKDLSIDLFSTKISQAIKNNHV